MHLIPLQGGRMIDVDSIWAKDTYRGYGRPRDIDYRIDLPMNLRISYAQKYNVKPENRSEKELFNKKVRSQKVLVGNSVKPKKAPLIWRVNAFIWSLASYLIMLTVLSEMANKIGR